MSTVYRLVVPRANAPHDFCLLHHRLQGCLTTAVPWFGPDSPLGRCYDDKVLPQLPAWNIQPRLTMSFGQGFCLDIYPWPPSPNGSQSRL